METYSTRSETWPECAYLSTSIQCFCDARYTVPTYIVTAFKGPEPLQLHCTDKRLIQVDSAKLSCNDTVVVCSYSSPTTNTSCEEYMERMNTSVQQCEGQLYWNAACTIYSSIAQRHQTISPDGCRNYRVSQGMRNYKSWPFCIAVVRFS